jgi:lycopene cyclase domain-containing protein
VLAGVVLVALTLVVDYLMIAAGGVAYADAHISGLRIGLVPIEDLSYPLALAIALPGVWQLIPRGRRRDEA